MSKNNPYYDDNGVLLNKLNIRDEYLLEKIEYSNSFKNEHEIMSGEYKIQSKEYGINRIKEIHHHLFKEIYEWTGKERTIPSAKGFYHPEGIPDTLTVFSNKNDFSEGWKKIEEKTNEFLNSKNISFDEKKKQLVAIFQDVNHMHIFPEGNGRSTQIFMKQLAKEQNIDIKFENIKSQEKENWNYASAVSGTWGRIDEVDRHFVHQYASETKPLEKIFDTICHDLEKDKSEKNFSMKTFFTPEEKKEITEKKHRIKIKENQKILILKGRKI